MYNKLKIILFFIFINNIAYGQSCPVITEPTAISPICTKTNISGSGNNGSANVSVSGGTAPYTYLWSNGATSPSISNLSANTYSVTVTDANNCNSVCGVVVEPSNCITIIDQPCVLPIVGVSMPKEGTCSNANANNDASIVFTNISNANKAEKVIGTTFLNTIDYGMASLTVIGSNLTVTGLMHNTPYTFRFWNSSDCCFTDITVKTPMKNCGQPCPVKICVGVKITKM